MKYRIKIVTMNNGRKEYFPQIKVGWFFWSGLGPKGEVIGVNVARNTRNSALECIDSHFAGNATTRTIEFEYIEKT